MIFQYYSLRTLSSAILRIQTPAQILGKIQFRYNKSTRKIIRVRDRLDLKFVMREKKKGLKITRPSDRSYRSSHIGQLSFNTLVKATPYPLSSSFWYWAQFIAWWNLHKLKLVSGLFMHLLSLTENEQLLF